MELSIIRGFFLHVYTAFENDLDPVLCELVKRT